LSNYLPTLTQCLYGAAIAAGLLALPLHGWLRLALLTVSAMSALAAVIIVRRTNA